MGPAGVLAASAAAAAARRLPPAVASAQPAGPQAQAWRCAPGREKESRKQAAQGVKPGGDL
jgi:hypothetical protein